ncbi:carbohydrate ABC transporter permease [Paenibacillus ihuae]|uniref:carbohydrate ABC transporter permease n=1 Tax=Paenibacillus ihuae TaxID=1232431 RepID=UPI000ABCDDAB|nr:sugar ABC transporter permease [Paenibacillus ihuae]
MNTITGSASQTRKAFLLAGVLLTNAALHTLMFELLGRMDLPHIATLAVALLWGSFGLYFFYASFNWLTGQYSQRCQQRWLPYVFIGPAILLMAWLLLFPIFRTVYLSFMDAGSIRFVGLANYVAVFTERSLLLTLRNNLMWVAAGTFFSVGFGLAIAILADRSSFENTAKSIIFMPMAISFVATGIIWKFVFYYESGDEQIGLLNAITTLFGQEPQAWLTLLRPWNNLLLIAIMVWTQTGFAMVMFSSAIKGVPEELLEAGRIDGANETKIFFHIIIPFIQSTIWTVATTTVVFTLKIFDIVMVMTGGQYETEVIATQFYKQYFQFRNFGYGSALAIVLLLMITPIIYYNLRMFRKEGRM